MKIGGERLGCADPITAEQSYTAINDGKKYIDLFASPHITSAAALMFDIHLVS
jgi:hypothetical protein